MRRERSSLGTCRTRRSFTTPSPSNRPPPSPKAMPWGGVHEPSNRRAVYFTENRCLYPLNSEFPFVTWLLGLVVTSDQKVSRRPRNTTGDTFLTGIWTSIFIHDP